MLNSYSIINSALSTILISRTNLLNRHHHLHSIKAVQAKVVREVGRWGELMSEIQLYVTDIFPGKYTFDVSLTCNRRYYPFGQSARRNSSSAYLIEVLQ